MRNDRQIVPTYWTFNVLTEIPSLLLRQQCNPKPCDKYILLRFSCVDKTLKHVSELCNHSPACTYSELLNQCLRLHSLTGLVERARRCNLSNGMQYCHTNAAVSCKTEGNFVTSASQLVFFAERHKRV